MCLCLQHRHVRHPRRLRDCELTVTQLNHISGQDIRERSLCRWVYEVDYDESRLPSCIPKVVRCINTVPNEALLNCEMVFFRFPVRRKTRSSSPWHDEGLQLPVACTLVRPRIHHVPIPEPPSLPFTIIN